MRTRTAVFYRLFVMLLCVAASSSLFSQDVIDDQVLREMIGQAAEYRNRAQIDSAVTLACRIYRLSTENIQLHDTTKIMAINAMSWAHQLNGEYDSALVYSNQALDLKHKTNAKEDSLLIATLSNKATIHFRMKHYDSAISTFEYLLDINRRTQDSDNPIIAKNILNLGTLYYLAEDHEKAKEYLFESLQLIKKQIGVENKDYVIALSNVATVCRELGQLDKAEAYQLEALSLRKLLFGENSIEVAKGLLNLSNLYIQRGEYSEALPLSNRAYEMFVEFVGKYHDYTYAALLNLGRISDQRGHYEQSEELYREALDVARQLFGDKSPDVATAMERLATVYRFQGRFSETIPVLNDALDVFTNHYGEQNLKVASVLHQLSVDYLILGNYERAESMQLRALQTREEILGASSIDVASDLSSLANIHRLKGDCRKALELQERSLSILDDIYGDENPQTVDGKKGLAAIHNDLGEYDKAESLVNEVLQSYLQTFGEVHPNIAFTYKLMADIEYGRRDHRRAEDYYTRAYRILSEYLGENHPSLGEIEVSLGRTLSRLGSFDEAGRVFAKFIKHRQEFLDYAFPLSSEEQKINIIRRFPVLNSDIIDLALATDVPQINLLAFEMVVNGKASVINAIRNERSTAVCNLNDDLRDILESHSEIRSTIASLAYVSFFDEKQYLTADSLQSLYSVHDSLEIELAQVCQDLNHGDYTTEYSLAAIKGALPDNGLLIEYYKSAVGDSIESCVDGRDHNHHRYVALVVTEDPEPTVFDLGSSSIVDNLIVEIRQAIEGSYVDLHSPIAADIQNSIASLTNRLYRQTIMPILAKYPGYCNITISPDGLLHMIPFGILADNQNNYLVENYEFSYITSSRDLIHPDDIESRDYRAIVIADPDFDAPSDYAGLSSVTNDTIEDEVNPREYSRSANCLSGGFDRLGYGADEYQAISRILKGDSRMSTELYCDNEAREAVLKNLSAPPFLIHMITHGFYCNDLLQSEYTSNLNPLLKSGLAMAGANKTLSRSNLNRTLETPNDDILTAFEVTSLNLEGTSLVTLSACESGMGQTLDGEGVFGLRCAFQSAGVRSLLMSLWRIPDKETSQLMEYFYSFWVNGDSKSTALRKAELRMIETLRDKTGYAPPFLWGGFVLTGDPE